MPKITLVFGFLSLMLLLNGCSRDPEYYQSDVPVTEPPTVESSENSSEGSIVDSSEPPDTILSEINLDVPFYSQAPFGDWGMPYQEACEEASLLLAYYYVTGQDPTIDEFHENLLAMVNWEVIYFGQYEHTTIEQTADIASLYLGHMIQSGEYRLPAWEIIDNPTIEDIKTQLSKGYPVVAPFAGRYLGNPYFTGEGPVYHMLVIRGYDDEHFITNDVGTRHGENFIYEYDVLMEALHDWHDSAAYDPEGITQGAKRILVLKPIP